MKGVVIYESLHGSTEKCAKILNIYLENELEIRKLKDIDDIDLAEYDTVIIGGSIHHGVIQSRVEKFIKDNHIQLMGKNLGLYLCCMEEGETAIHQFEKAYPADLRKKAIAKGLFGGEFNLKKMNYFEKKITRKATGVKTSVSKINEDEIKKFAMKLNKN